MNRNHFFLSELTRRRFLEGAAATVGGVGAASLITTARAAEPKKGGHARFAMIGGAPSDSIDPAHMNEIFPYVMNWCMRNCLTELSSTAEVVPELAESWDTSADLKTWTFRLRRGVTFHNGKSLEASDVIASLNYHRGDASKSGGKLFLADVGDIKAGDKQTVIITLIRPNADLPALLSDVHLTIQPADASGSIDISGVGTGPFVLDGFNPGVRATLKRNVNYWKAGRGNFDTIDLLNIIDPAARSSALRSGAVDVMLRVEAKTADLLARQKGLRIIEVPTAGHYNMPMIATVPPFDNNDVRLALKHAIDREAVIKTAMLGHATLGNDNPIGRTYKYFADDIPVRAYDVDKAKFHLRKAGHDTLNVELVTSIVIADSAPDIASLMREQARAAGINITIRQAPGAGYYSHTWKKAPWCMSRFSGRATEAVMLSWEYGRQSAGNESFWSNERFDSLLAQSLATVDDSKRRELYRELQLVVRDEGATLTYAFPNAIHAVNDKIQTPEKVSPVAELDGYRAPERWWFA